MARNAIIFKLEDFEWEKVVEEDVIERIVYSRAAFFCWYLGRTSKGFVRIGLGWKLLCFWRLVVLARGPKASTLKCSRRKFLSGSSCSLAAVSVILLTRLECLSFEVFLAAPCGAIGAFMLLFVSLPVVFGRNNGIFAVTLLSSQRTDT
ncbi:hypothetical protein TSUD_43320 [Trifolium subterraneum]|uniref:Transmembrane protein n=1 Tax=Trifolium subterraneum TaxID=3900 RepID=A0A2Z6PI06_TRISU|nr:hypothetical protein TSUD_43320 [Trifolium subterraneum]